MADQGDRYLLDVIAAECLVTQRAIVTLARMSGIGKAFAAVLAQDVNAALEAGLATDNTDTFLRAVAESLDRIVRELDPNRASGGASPPGR